MKAVLALVLMFAVPSLVFAASSSAALPRSLAMAQALKVSQGTCEARWEQLGNVLILDLDEGYQGWLVPCALWAHNQAYAVYITINESSRPEGYITKPIFFVNYTPNQGIHADDVIHNVQWQASQRSLIARYFLNGKETCGSMARYEWDKGQQNFLLKELYKQDDCGASAGPWTKVDHRPLGPALL